MAKFVFRLAVVLRQRKRAEQECQRALAERLAVLVELQNALKRLDESAKNAGEDLRKNHLTGAIDLTYLAAHRRYMNAMQQQGLEIAKQIGAAQTVVDAARAKLTEAAKARKVIEKLRERQFERWQLDQSRRETAATDEIGSQIGYRDLIEDGRCDDVEAAT
jgi:flagellar protein FliJ